MPSSSLNAVVHHLRSAAEQDGAGRTDGELLTLFLSRRDEDALAALVERHAPMVWGVCRRILRNPHAVEDAFQATFLVLVQKATTVVPREMVANWLHGVAHQTAVRLRATAARRGWREVQMDVMIEPAVVEARDEELLSRLDEELNRLPERCRALIVLCDLEGRTRKEVARQLGCPEGTVASGLARARELLAKRLTRRGLAVSGGSLAATLSHSVASADVPASVVTSAINVATLLAAGKAAGEISGPVATLTQGVLKTMFLKKILTTTMAVLALGAAVITGGSLAVGQTEGKPAVSKVVKAPVAEKPVVPAAKPEAEVAWGKEENGLQLGLVLVPADKTAFRPGETMEFIVKVRNVSKKNLTLSSGLPESTPRITDAQGEEVQAIMPPLLGFIVIPTEQVLQPGETVELHHRKVAVEGVQTGRAEQTGHVGTPTIRVGAGKYKIAFPEFVTQDVVRSTGEVEFEVKGGDEKKQPEQKEAFTAWGKESGGLQAGLGLLPGAKRVYRQGETVTLVVRVRNVGKVAVKFEYVRQFLDENRPTVTNADGKAVPQSGTDMMGIHGPTEVNIEPGQEVVLETRMHGSAGSPYALLPEIGGVSSNKAWPLLVGTGKFSLRYERVIGNSSSGFLNKLDPALEKLATGKLELEVKEPEPTAWGKEVGGLQAGLGFKAGEKRVYTHGEKVTLVVRLRNVGTEPVSFGEGLVFWRLTNPISVTDSDGKAVYVQCLRPVGSFGQLGHQKTQLPPGKEVEYDQVTLQLKPAVAQEKQVPDNILFGTGKFRVEYRTDGFGSNNPTTGKLELEVKEAPAETPKSLTPEAAVKIAGDSELAKKFNANKPAVEFKVEFVTKAIQVKASGEKDAAWAHGHSPDDVCLGLLVPNTPGAAIDLVKRDHIRFVATLTAKVIGQLNKVGITDLEKHFKGKTVRVTGPISRHAYDGFGSPDEVEIVLDDMSQLEVVK